MRYLVILTAISVVIMIILHFIAGAPPWGRNKGSGVALILVLLQLTMALSAMTMAFVECFIRKRILKWGFIWSVIFVAIAVAHYFYYSWRMFTNKWDLSFLTIIPYVCLTAIVLLLAYQFERERG